jgi:hypothetical protein
MNREIVKLSTLGEYVKPYLAFEGGIYEDKERTYEEVNEEVTYRDMEKGYEDITKVYKRVSDGKYFKWSYSYSPHVGLIDYACSEELVEVFPEQVTITTYV